MQGYAGDKYTNKVGEGHITIYPWHYSAITQGTWAWIASSAQIYYGLWYNSTSAQNDQIDYKVYLDAGTYTFTVCHRSYTDKGIITILDGVSTLGTLDLYASPGAYNVIVSATGLTVTTAGLRTLSLKMATKNASSTSYSAAICSIVLYRTA